MEWVLLSKFAIRYISYKFEGLLIPMKSFANYSKNLHYYANLTFYFFFEQKNTGNFPVGFFCLNNVICFKKKITLAICFWDARYFWYIFRMVEIEPQYFIVLYVLSFCLYFNSNNFNAIKICFSNKIPFKRRVAISFKFKKKICFFKLIIYFGKKN